MYHPGFPTDIATGAAGITECIRKRHSVRVGRAACAFVAHVWGVFGRSCRRCPCFCALRTFDKFDTFDPKSKMTMMDKFDTFDNFANLTTQNPTDKFDILAKFD